MQLKRVRFWRNIALGLLFLVIGLTMALRSASIQIRVINALASLTSEQTGLHLAAKSVSLDWSNRSIVLHECRASIKTERDSPIFFVAQIKLGGWTRMADKWSIQHMEFEDGEVNIDRLQHALSSIPESEVNSETKGGQAAIASLVFQKIKINLNSPNIAMKGWIERAELVKLKFDSAGWQADLDAFQGHWLEGRWQNQPIPAVQIDSMKFSASLQNGFCTVSDWHLASNIFRMKTHFQAHLSDDYFDAADVDVSITSPWTWSEVASWIQPTAPLGDWSWITSATTGEMAWEGSLNWEHDKPAHMELAMISGLPLSIEVDPFIVELGVDGEWMTQGLADVDLTNWRAFLQTAPDSIQHMLGLTQLAEIEITHPFWQFDWKATPQHGHVHLRSQSINVPKNPSILGTWDMNSDSITHDFQVHFEGLPLSSWAGMSPTRSIDFSGEWNGFIRKDTFSAEGSMQLGTVNLISQITGHAPSHVGPTSPQNTAEWEASILLSSTTREMPFSSEWTAEWNPTGYKVEADLILEGIQAPYIKYDRPWELHANVHLQLQGGEHFNHEGRVLVRNINLLEDGAPRAFERFDLISTYSDERIQLEWMSDLGNGHLRASNDWSAWKRWMYAWSDRGQSKHLPIPELEAAMQVQRFDPIALLSNVPLHFETGSRLNASSTNGALVVTAEAPSFRYGNWSGNSLFARIDGSYGEIFANGRCDSLAHSDLPILSELALDIHGDSLWQVDIEWRQPDSSLASAQGLMRHGSHHEATLELTDLIIPWNKQRITLSDETVAAKWKSAPDGWRIEAPSLALQSEDIHFEMSGFLEQSGAHEFQGLWKGQQVSTEALTFAPHMHLAEHRLHWESAGKTWRDWLFQGQFWSDSLSWKGLEIHGLEGLVRRNPVGWDIAINGTSDGGEISAAATVPVSKTDAWSASVQAQSLPIDWINAYIPENIARVNGSISANITGSGTRIKPNLTGWIQAEKLHATLPYMGTAYDLIGVCDISDDTFHLNQWDIKDPYGHVSILDGSIQHQDFQNWNVDATLRTDEDPFWIMNIESEANDYFFGEAFAFGEIDLSSDANTLNIDAHIETASGTQFALPLNGARDANYASFITFETDLHVLDVKPAPTAPLKDGVRIEMDLTVDVTEAAETRIIFDESVGDEIMGTTKGSLTLHTDDFERFSMSGQLEVVEGVYLFTLQNVFNKRFDIQPGGTMVWFGDPYDAQISLETRYQTRTDLAPLLPSVTDLPGHIPVHLTLSLDGKLMRPDIGFGVTVPDADARIQALVDGALINEDELNRQAISLLVLQQFLSPEPITAAIGNEGLQDQSTAFLASQLGHWISQVSPDIDVGLDYSNNTISGEQALAVALSTRLFNDRLHVDGAVGTEQLMSGDMGDFQLQDITLSYDIQQDGHLQIIGHNRTNTGILGPYGSNSQGIGIRFYRDFNRWGDWNGAKNEQ